MKRRSRSRVEEREDVLLAHPSAAPAAGDLRKVDPVLSSDPLHDGGVAGAFGGSGRAPLGAVRRRSAFRSRSDARDLRNCHFDSGVALPTLRALAGDPRQHRSDRDDAVHGYEDLGDYAGDRGRDLGVDLVSRDLADRLVSGDPIAHLNPPRDHRAFGDRDPHLGHRHVD